MDVGTLLSVVQTVLATLQCSELKDIGTILHYKSELEDLKGTIETIKTVLRDAESVELSDQQQLWIKDLNYAVYDSDDLLDEFLTLAQKNKLLKSGRVSEKVRNLFSRFNFLRTAHKFSGGVKEIRRRLDSIVENHNRFGFKLDCKPIRQRREETCSYVDTKDIIGREKELQNILSTLLDPNVQTDVSCLSIVGMGGLGKTTLAQLIYNHPQIKENFPLKLWTCVSDEDPKNLDLKATLCKILHSVTSGNHENLSTDHLQRKVREVLGGNKYLLVLDDVWNENRFQLQVLAKFLMSGSKGSWIVVTTRSQVTATIVGEQHIYELKGLSEDDSWCLFEMAAFGHNQENSLEDLVAIGREIVKKCANVPLAIKVVGSLLYGHEKEKWLSFLKIGLGTLNGDQNGGIEPILKLSYNHLDSPLKACFSFCALFPKDHIIDKGMLIDLWMAQDYIVPMEGQSMEDAGNEYISILLKICFFQDLQRDKTGKVVSFKIHDLMHDIAQKVAGNEIFATNYFKTDFDDKIRHLSYLLFDENKITSFNRNKVRTCIHLQEWRGIECSSLDLLLRNWVSLRALDLKKLEIESLPSTLGKLLHLRYLDLSENRKLQMLPMSIGQLLNLQTLKLRNCWNLKEMPKDLVKLVKLRVLDIEGCTQLNGMPQGMGKLTCLQKLPLFVVGDNHSTSKQSIVGQMNDLKALENLRGRLVIKIPGNAEYAEESVRETGYIRNKEWLDCVDIQLPMENRMVKYEEGLLLEKLHPHSNLRELSYKGCRRMPSWASGNNLQTFLPNLVKIELCYCHELQHLPSLRKLRYLKSLEIRCLFDLEYIEDSRIMSRASEFETFFPSLKKLSLENLEKLKGWWRDDEVIDCGSKQGFSLLPSFPCLSRLSIWNCPNLTCVPTCPTIEELYLSFTKLSKGGLLKNIESGNSKLRILHIKDSAHLKDVFSISVFHCLHTMYIRYDDELQNLSELEEVLHCCSSSLQYLEIEKCPNLKSLHGGLEHLTALNKLKLQSLPKIVNLPNDMHYLTALQSLKIEDCHELKSMPESMRDLTSLKRVHIVGCSEILSERCQEHTGEDWPNIQHIPNFTIW